MDARMTRGRQQAVHQGSNHKDLIMGEFTESPIITLQHARENLKKGFLKGEEPDFQERNAEALDDYFQACFINSKIGPHMHIDKNPYAFIALGGYGRKEQSLESDVDILVIFKKKVPPEMKALVRELFYPLWDIGLEVGYATRTIKECLSMASDDFEILTPLLDARFLCGMSLLYSELIQKLHDKNIAETAKEFCSVAG